MVEATRSARQVMHIYRQVIDHVINSLRPVFEDENTDVAVLEELQAVWMRKLTQRNCVVRPPTTSAAAAYPHAQVDGSADCDLQEQPASAELAMTMTTTDQSTLSVAPPSSLQAATAAKETALENVASAQAGALALSASAKDEDDEEAGAVRLSFMIPQVDGGDSDDEFISEDESDLNSEDDDANSEENDDMENYILCQFDKILRSKKRWKGNLKDGIMQIDGTDVLFSKAVGEWDW